MLFRNIHSFTAFTEPLRSNSRLLNKKVVSSKAGLVTPFEASRMPCVHATSKNLKVSKVKRDLSFASLILIVELVVTEQLSLKKPPPFKMGTCTSFIQK